MSNGHITLDPTPGKLIFALRAIGYSLPQAVADLIDNSINAKARNVAVRVITTPTKIARILILDDGHGMTKSELDESMRLGSDSHRAVNSLGKYGMGLKLASLSQAQNMTVITRSKGFTGGRRWTIDGISSGWQCEVIDDSEAIAELDNPADSVDLEKHGTVIVWSELDKIKPSKNGVDATVSTMFNHLKQHLGLHFHRFIEDGRLTIYLEKAEERRPGSIKADTVLPLNPFDYEASGDSDFPETFRLELGAGHHLDLEAHIWPPKSSSPNYKLGGKAAARQGFYFYRNDRLIQAGGWNETMATESEPHLSLARVRIDLPKSLDEMFGLSVQKSSIQTPPSFSMELSTVKSKGGLKFNDFKKQADKIYRAGERKDTSNFPAVPDVGLHKGLRNALHKVIAGSTGRTRKVEFVWQTLARDMFFELRRDDAQIALNSIYRKRILQGRPAGSGDAPLIKVLLFVVSQEFLFSERFSSKQREQVDRLNAMLMATLDSMDEA